MKNANILIICKICLIIIAIVFLVITVCTKFENNLYLLLSVACSLIVNILNLIKSTSKKKDK